MVGVGVGEDWDSGGGVGEGRVSLGLGASEGSKGYHQLHIKRWGLILVEKVQGGNS